MLHLQNSYVGAPTTRLHHLVLPQETLLLYPSADGVVILNAASLQLVRVLAFWEAFPSTMHTADRVSCISVDSNMKLIVAAMGNRIASWSLSGVKHDAWHIHSTLVLPSHQVVAAMHNRSGLLAIATQSSLSVHTLILDNNLPTWSQKWIAQLRSSPSLVRFAPSLMYIATTRSDTNAVMLYSTTSGKQIQAIPHPRQVIRLNWRHSSDNLILYTVTSDSTLRVFFPVLDSPQHLQLHASIDLFSASIPTPDPRPSTVFIMDREVIGRAFENISAEQDTARTRRIQEIKEEGWDLFLRVLGDGSVVVTALANVDRKPPTLLKQFTLQQSPPSTLPEAPSFLYVLPHPNKSIVTLVTSSPLASYELSPAAFFDAQQDGLKLLKTGPKRMPDENSEIERFIRTPEGEGLGIIRKNGNGQVWKVTDDGLELVHTTKSDLIVLNKGREFEVYDTEKQMLGDVKLPQVTSFFTIPDGPGQDSIIGITEDLSVAHIRGKGRDRRVVCVPLPMDERPAMILPVDPMAWGLNHPWAEHDVLLSVSQAGKLAFWIPEDSVVSGAVNGNSKHKPAWRCTGTVKTGRTSIKTARCSSAKKTALVVSIPEGDELTIWDSKESEFASGMEYQGIFSEPIRDLDWTSTPDMQSILAVGFDHHVDLLCQQRMTYFDPGPGWSICWKIDIQASIPYPISDSIWLSNGRLLVGAGHQMFLYGQRLVSSGASERSTFSGDSLFESVARQNGSLPDYHPQMLLQCLLWEKVDLVKDIIVNLWRDIQAHKSQNDFTRVPIERYFSTESSASSGHKKRYTQLFDGPEMKDDDEPAFSRASVTKLIEELEENPLPHLTPNEQAHLLVLIQTTLEIDEQRRSLDSSGLRYLISMRSFYILNRRASSSPISPISGNARPRGTGRRERLRYRDIIWAFHSESQGLLMTASISSCKGKMTWSDARALGIPIWLTSLEQFKLQVENIARNEFLVDRDPTSCSLFYFALGKVKLVQSLWRQAAWHKEQGLMLKFLANDFSEDRWKTAALKNAYALLGKRRFEYAAAFFLLGQSLKDAVNVCIRQLGDFQIAITIARVVEQSNEGPVFLDILKNTVLPIAFKDGNRWLASWAFWLLHRRDLSVRVLVTPLQELVGALDIQVKEIGEPHYDDPSLALLFSQLRSKTLQTAKGTKFNFVLQIARVFCRMGCQVLALDLVRSWTFDVPPPIAIESPRPLRNPRYARRRSSMMIDMDIMSLPPTRRASPPPPVREEEEVIKNEGDFLARKAGLGNLMKSAKQDVKVPEFDMSAFF
ncbi:WD repeat-containing protein [Hymenopellis radicata]|nr:WD repeat-containing protein [Hymenopellis radicata]